MSTRTSKNSVAAQVSNRRRARADSDDFSVRAAAATNLKTSTIIDGFLKGAGRHTQTIRAKSARLVAASDSGLVVFVSRTRKIAGNQNIRVHWAIFSTK
jgi:hypothetical protein